MIRRLQPKDRAHYLAMAHAFYAGPAVDHPIPDAYLARTFEEMMRSDPYAEGYLFEEAGTVQGYALLAKTWSQEAGGMVLWIEEIYVLPQFQGHGIGQAFFDYLRREKRPARFRLETEPDNQRAKALYRRQGFAPLHYDSFILGD